MPKIKTHHWAGVTLSLKNMFGIVPGMKYGWPSALAKSNPHLLSKTDPGAFPVRSRRVSPGDGWRE
jgi:hypothetical protein